MMGDPTELQQVVMNLGTNAAQAMDGRGSLAIWNSTRVEPGEELTLSHGSLPPGRYVRLIVSDTRPRHGAGRRSSGCSSRSSRPSRSARVPGSGCRPSTASSPSMAAPSNVRSRPGQGTTFEVYFPRSEGAAAVEDKQSRGARSPRPWRDDPHRRRRQAARAAWRGDAGRARLRAGRLRQQLCSTGGVPRRSETLRFGADRRGHARDDGHRTCRCAAPGPSRASDHPDDRIWPARCSRSACTPPGFARC